MKLGVTLASYHLDIREAIARASALGLKGFEVEATRGEITCALSRSGRRDFLHYSKSLKMEVCALSGCLGQGFGQLEGLEQLYENTKKLIDLAVDLRAPVVTTFLGRIPFAVGSRERNRITEVLHELGKYAENFERTLAAHIGETSFEELKKFIAELKTEGIGVAYDPSITVARGFDSVKGVKDLKGLIAYAYARDITKEAMGFIEVVPGRGIVPFQDYIMALYEIGYTGFYVIRRESPEGRVEDISRAKEFLEKLTI